MITVGFMLPFAGDEAQAIYTAGKIEIKIANAATDATIRKQLAEALEKGIDDGAIGVGQSAGEVAQGAGKSLTPQQLKSVRSYEKLIVEHRQKILDFKANPTVRPGMEGLPKEAIARQQATRIQHLETEIRTFENNIKKIIEGTE